MNEHPEPAATQNPFRASRLRPGAVPFRFAAGQSAAQLAERLRRNGWWGQILGPHGSGKSALLAALRPAIELAGRRTFLSELHDGQRRLPPDFKRTPELSPSAVLIVDGYEQLSRWSRFRLKRFCRRGGLGLLVTAHTPVGLSDLFQTEMNLQIARQIVEDLLAGYPPHVTPDDVAQPFSRHGENLRETLFELYDLYEQRRRGTSP